MTTTVTADHVSAEVASKVLSAIDCRGSSMRVVADAIHRPLTTFHRKTKGEEKYEFSLTELLRIADALDVEPRSLLPEAFSPDCSCGCCKCGS
ncbi:hypothetical protein Leucomu_10645 [Leucobacter muris]|uniref:XRE family transcriptional regulator n=1 Tax=Leucobacter muris TaxID=1935379 RepID=A0ABX5QH65_9MICO|nr:hypothetical protein [Leucobacter muris]QAB18313.1 hypothetical protein Leucomu_10645 [Leucobacter muris]